MIIFFYWLLCILSCVYAFIYGGKEGRIVSFLLILAAITTLLFYFDDSWIGINKVIFFIDLLLFLSLYIVCIWSAKNWLLWISGIQSAGVFTHIAAGIGIKYPPHVYQLFQGFWAVALIFVMVIGIHGNRVFYDKKFNFRENKSK